MLFLIGAGVDFENLTKPFDDTRVDDISQQDGVVDVLGSLDMSLSDQEIIQNLHRRIEDSRDYWNDPKGYNIEDIRSTNVKFHLGQQIDEQKLYRYQTPYVDNEIFIGVESILAYATSQIPQAETFPADKSSETSKILAKDLQKALYAHSEQFELDRKVEACTRNLLLQQFGLIGLRFDPNYGKDGEIIPEVISPEHVIIDKNAAMGEEPGFICIIRKATVEELVQKFPDAKEAIYKELGIKRGTASQMSRVIVYREVWCTYYEEDGSTEEGVVFYFGKCVLDKSKDPNWLYDEDGKNFLENHTKPFTPFNYINDGSHWIDATGPVHQAVPLQRILNKRGRQIMDNADTANGIQVFSSEALSKEDVENLTGDPRQKIVVESNDVNKAVMSIQPEMLPEFVLEDKMDLRQTIHAVLGTPPQFTGSGQKADQTLGQDLMQRNQAQGRQDGLVRAINAAMDRYFKILTQMMVVWYDEEHYFDSSGEDGSFDKVAISNAKIEKGVSVRVKSGSTLPLDKGRIQAVALQLSQEGLIAPIDLYNDLQLDDAQQRYNNLMKWKIDPKALATDLDEATADRQAHIEFVEILGGQDVAVQDDIKPEHLMAHQAQLISDAFLKAEPEKQQKLIELVKKETESLQRRTMLEATMAKGIAQIQAMGQAIVAPPAPMGMPMPGGMPPAPGAPGMPVMAPAGPGGGMIPHSPLAMPPGAGGTLGSLGPTPEAPSSPNLAGNPMALT